MSKRAGATRSGSRPGRPGRPAQGGPAGAKPAQRRQARAWSGWWPLLGALAVALVVGVVVFTLQSQREPAGQGAVNADFGHIHGLAVDPGTGSVHVATHAGLFRVDDPKTAVRVSKEAPDLMGFSVAGPGHFVASGHPDAHGSGPANLGLIESTDGGVTWQTTSLSGAADFHGLRAAHGMVYGYNSTDGAFMVSTDRRTWQRRSTVAMGAFAVSPTEPDTVIAVGRTGLQRSTDGGRNWQAVAGTPRLAVLAWDQAAEAWGVAPDGGVWRSTDGGATWQQRGQVPGQPQAITVHEGTLYVGIAGDRVVASADGGATWTTRYAAS